MTAAETTAPRTPPIAWPSHWARGSVPRMLPALKSFITSPARPQATATTPAMKKSCTSRTCANAETSSSTMRPKISMGSMPVCPHDCALMAVVTKARSTTTTLTTGGSPSPMHMRTTMAAASTANVPASVRTLPVTSDSAAPVPFAPRASPAPRTPRAMLASCGTMSLATTASPAPIMSPMPRLFTMPCAASTDQSPAALPATTMPKLARRAPANHQATATPPTRKPTESIMGEL